MLTSSCHLPKKSLVMTAVIFVHREREMKLSPPFSILGLDTKRLIFNFLDWEAARILRLVCKEWNNIILTLDSFNFDLVVYDINNKFLGIKLLLTTQAISYLSFMKDALYLCARFTSQDDFIILSSTILKTKLKHAGAYPQVYPISWRMQEIISLIADPTSVRMIASKSKGQLIIHGEPEENSKVNLTIDLMEESERVQMPRFPFQEDRYQYSLPLKCNQFLGFGGKVVLSLVVENAEQIHLMVAINHTESYETVYTKDSNGLQWNITEAWIPSIKSSPPKFFMTLDKEFFQACMRSDSATINFNFGEKKCLLVCKFKPDNKNQVEISHLYEDQSVINTK